MSYNKGGNKCIVQATRNIKQEQSDRDDFDEKNFALPDTRPDLRIQGTQQSSTNKRRKGRIQKC